MHSLNIFLHFFCLILIQPYFFKYNNLHNITTIFYCIIWCYNEEWSVEKRYRARIGIAAQDKNADESVFFRVYQQFQSDLSESCALFLVRLRSTFRQLVKNRVCENTYEGPVKMARPKLSWGGNTYVILRIRLRNRARRGGCSRGVAAVRRKECINCKFRTDAACFEIYTHRQHERHIYLYETHACSISHVHTYWKGYVA